MNVRSPYYVIADETGKPEPPADDDISDVDPDVPDEYQEPDTLTEGVSCGDIVNIGEDVGTRIFSLNTDNRVGDVDIDYDVSIPVKIQATWDGNTVHVANQDYVGDSSYQTQMEAAGISTDDMTLTSGGATGTLTINKSTAEPSDVTVQVTSALRNDEYNLTFNCPARPARVVGTLPSPPDGSNIAYNVPVFWVWGNPQISITINGVQVINRQNAFSGSPFAQQFWAFVITDNSQVGNYKEVSTAQSATQTTFISKSQNLKTGWNNITVRLWTTDSFADSQQNIWLNRGGIFHNGTSWGWATANNASLYDYNVSPQLDSGIWKPNAPNSWSQEHYFREMDFQWYEESTGQAGERGYWKPIMNKRIYNNSQQIVRNMTDLIFPGESLNVLDGDLR